ncbi:DUF6502 family protein [Thiomicrorhabdus lithotrophica]|uniref:DUF6502 family protein n=1 Tax=Thiomicrorhabdus lithotrophica TaxID=2949997 RepID=A0ABY8CBS4_9GAMM|nr:DUF6502 family protein [Thiomicrorhabdus lithotrophica]WEJ62937.1 DUF6502 family protein [Thiomicrorhabdus lithotrophica]
MKETLQTALSISATKILRPLIRIMIRNGVSCGNFEEMVRKAYVDEAFALGHEQSNKTTVSSVSAQTGLSRKEVKRLKELENLNRDQNDQKYNRATRVISGWTNDEIFVDSTGQPKALRLDNEEASFANLVKMYSGDITTKAMFDLLLSAECISQEDELIHLIKPAYLPGNDSAEVALILGSDTHELIKTISHNMATDDHNKRFQRKVSTTKLSKMATEEFKKLSAQHSQALLEDLDAWLSAHEAEPNTESQYVSLGIYYYESNNEEFNHET